MAAFVATNFVVTIAGTNVSDHVTAIDMPIEYAEVDQTAMGDDATNFLAGLANATVTVGLHQDYASSSVDSLLWTNKGTAVTVTVKATSAATSATNPLYSGSFLMSRVNPVPGQIGSLSTLTLTWPLASGTLPTRATA